MAGRRAGLPRPGEFYIQVITPGYLIVLQAGGRQYEYHTDSGQDFTLCREGAGTGLPATGSTFAGAARWLPLWGVLALGLAAGAIGVTVARRRGARRGGWSLRRAQAGSGGLRRAQAGSGGLRRAQAGSGGLRRRHHGSA